MKELPNHTHLQFYLVFLVSMREIATCSIANLYRDEHRVLFHWGVVQCYRVYSKSNLIFEREICGS